MKLGFWTIVVILLSIGTAVAQDATCAEVQQTTFDAVLEYCPQSQEYALCYGNPTISVQYNQIGDGDDTLRFALPGDRIPRNVVDWFSTSSEANTWGVVDIDIVALNDDVASAVFGKMIVFGDVIVHNEGTADILIFTDSGSVASRQGANLRSQPSTDSNVVETLMYQTSLQITGKLADDTWVRVHTSKDDYAWLSTEAVSVYDMGRIPVVDPNETPPALTMSFQSFNFQSGLPMTNCDGAGLSGILLQTYSPYSPELDRNLLTNFDINGVQIAVAGTVFMQAHPNTGLLVSVIDGTAEIMALDEMQKVDEGYVSRTFMDLDAGGQLVAVEPPSTPLVYDYDALSPLPLSLLAEVTLGRDVTALITPRPIGGESPIAGMALDAPCKLTTGESGANIRSEPSSSGEILAVLGYRESAEPIARVIGADGLPWWKLAEDVFIRIDTTVTGGNCTSVPRIDGEG